MKACFKCNIKKPLTDFYKHKQMSDGHFNKCKQCTKNEAYKHRHFSDQRQKILAYDRERGNRQSYEDTKIYRGKYPKKHKAHNLVNNEIRHKRLLKKPCQVCGKTKVHGHHDDYNIPLKVRWLCAEHHHQWHSKHGEGRNAI